jgi:hypothetical protein
MAVQPPYWWSRYYPSAARMGTSGDQARSSWAGCCATVPPRLQPRLQDRRARGCVLCNAQLPVGLVQATARAWPRALGLTPCLQSSAKMSDTVADLGRSPPGVHPRYSNVQVRWCRLWVSSQSAGVHLQPLARVLDRLMAAGPPPCAAVRAGPQRQAAMTRLPAPVPTGGHARIVPGSPTSQVVARPRHD